MFACAWWACGSSNWDDTLLGGDAGNSDDFMTVDVVVLEKDEQTLQTGASVSSNRGAFFLVEKNGRLAELSQAIAEILTAEI